MKIIEKAWSVTLFFPKAWKSVTLRKPPKTLGAPHFSCKKQKNVTIQACLLILCEKHCFFATLQPFLLILGENHWKRLECRTFLAKSMKKCDTSSVFADFRWKSLKTLGVSHFSSQKHEKSVTLLAFLLILSENHWKRLECHTFLTKSMKKCDASSVFADFKWKSLFFCNTSSVFADFRWKSLKTLGVSHFSCTKHEKVWHFKRFCWF